MTSAIVSAARDAAFFGAVPSQEGVRFRAWAVGASRLVLQLHDGAAAGRHPLAPAGDGLFETWVRGAAAGDRYTYTLDGGPPLPDPASRFQPDGVHGPSQVIDATAASRGRTRAGARGRPATWSSTSSTSAPSRRKARSTASERQLPYLRDLGVTAIELMPVADFAGHRNWGYDGVALFAPSRAYGTPDDLRRLVDSAHEHGLSVILDVVYNHLGPEGAYLPQFSRAYLDGQAPNALGRGGGSRRRRSGVAASSSTTPLTGSASITSTACGSMRRMRSIERQPGFHRPGSRASVTAGRASGPSSSTPKTTETWRRWSRTRARAAGSSTASGPTTFTTSSAACGRRPPLVLRRLRRDRAEELATIMRDGLAVSPGSTRAHEPAARHRPRPRADASIRHLPAEPRSDRQPRDRRSAASHDPARNLARRERRAAHRADDATAVHGPGMGRLDAVPILHRSRTRLRQPRHRRTAPGVRRVPGVLGSRRDARRIPDPQAETRFAAASCAGRNRRLATTRAACAVPCAARPPPR